MRVGDRLFEFFRREVIRLGSQGKIFAAQVHGIGTEMQCRFQFCKTARRREQFGAFVHRFLRRVYRFLWVRRIILRAAMVFAQPRFRALKHFVRKRDSAH